MSNKPRKADDKNKNKSFTKTGPGRVATTGRAKSGYNPKIVPGFYITYSEQDRLVRENGYNTAKVKELMKDRNAFLNSYRSQEAAPVAVPTDA